MTEKEVKKDKNVTIDPVVVASILAGGALLTYSTKVSADPIKIIADAMAKAIKYVFNNMTDDFYKQISDMAKGSQSSVETLMGIGIDSINKVSTTIFDNDIELRSYPMPDPCNASKSASSVGAFTGLHGKSAKEYSTSLQQYQLISGANDKRLLKMAHSFKERYGDNWSTYVSARAAIFGKKVIEGEDQVQLANDWLLNMTATTQSHYPSLLKTITNKKTGSLSIMASVKGVAVGSISRAIFADSIAVRLGKDGKSMFGEIAHEINKTYGDREGKWRAHLNNSPSGVSNMKEALKTQAFNNYLRQLKVQGIEKRILVLSGLIIEALKGQQQVIDNMVTKL